MHIYEYLFAGIIMVAMILVSSILVGTLVTPQEKTSEREQLKVTAEKIVSQLLFNPGEPVHWGSDPTLDLRQLQTFGLAQYGESTRGAYVLDPYKILRLSNEINADPTLRHQISGLLNLGNDFGMALEFNVPLNVNVTSDLGSGRYNIRVTSQLGGLPVFGAAVTAKLYFVSSGQIACSQQVVSSTDVTGNSAIDFGNSTSQSKGLVVVVAYSDTLVVKVVADRTADMLGTQIHSDTPLDLTTMARQVIVTNLDGFYAIQEVNSSLTPSQDGWCRLSNPEPLTVATLASANGDLVCASVDVTSATYSSISVSFEQLVNPVSYSIERRVTVNGLTYLITLYLWRMSY